MSKHSVQIQREEHDSALLAKKVSVVKSVAGESFLGDTGINGGPVTVGTSEVEVTFTGTTKSVMIQADPDNTGSVWFGLTGVTNSGGNAFAQLEPGDAVTMGFDDSSNALYAISDTAAQNIFKMALT